MVMLNNQMVKEGIFKNRKMTELKWVVSLSKYEWWSNGNMSRDNNQQWQHSTPLDIDPTGLWGL